MDGVDNSYVLSRMQAITEASAVRAFLGLSLGRLTQQDAQRIEVADTAGALAAYRFDLQ